ncbi:hypothetical protein CTI12_AA075330 [Artemisia annua]|uniref:Major facilitator superfamily protein n=1 Tax=Artemisia annua TaxID=35608 RepID=A0A2U1Q543_ARTAN|nr:hypothetical protein CTI12_AA075330 [Artemisia annua]
MVTGECKESVAWIITEYVKQKGSNAHVKLQTKHQKKLGGMRAAMFVYAMVGLENMAFISTAVSLVTYFYSYMNFSLTKSATTLTNYLGTAFLLSLFGGFISDTYLSRFKTGILFASFEVVGYALLAVQAHFQQLRPIPCNPTQVGPCQQVDSGQEAILFTGLYLIAFGTGGVKAALPSLGADQFDERDPKEAESLASFFNWFLFSVTTGAIFGVTFVVWISSNQGWDWALGVCSLAVFVAALFLLMGKSMFRNYVPKESAILRILQVFVVAIRNRNLQLPENTEELHDIHDKETGVTSDILQRTDQFRAAIVSNTVIASELLPSGSWKLCTVTQVEETKTLIRMLPIILSTIFMNTCLAQLQTFTIQQSTTMDRDLFGFNVPGPSIPVIPLVFMSILIPLYDRYFVPFLRKFTGISTGIRHLQRIGVGLVLSAISMAVAGIVETRRKSVASENNMVDSPGPLPMSVFWLGYQYAIFGVADMFTLVGLLEFFYEESSPGMKSLGTAISWCSLAFGYYMSSMVVEVVNTGINAHVKLQTKYQKKLGGTRAAMFVYAMVGLENMAFISTAVSLVTYFYSCMNFSLTKSATTLTNYLGTAFLLSLFGGFISDTYLSRFKTAILFASFEVVGYALLAVQAHFQQLRPIPCNPTQVGQCQQVDSGQEAILFTGLYLIAFGTGGVKAALPSLGADQFDERDPKEAESLASFFNWFLFSVTTGAIFGVTFVVWISSNQGWDWALGVCSIAVFVAALFLLMGKSMFRNYVPKESTILRILQVFVVAIRNRNLQLPENTEELHDIHDRETGVASDILQRTDQFRAAIVSNTVIASQLLPSGSWKLCTVTQVEETKTLIRMLPIILSTIFMNTCLAQLQTFTIQQSTTMDRDLFGFNVPGPSIPVIPLAFMSILIPLYDRFFVPFLRKFTGISTGIRHLQRIGVGLVLSAISMAVAGIVETRRKSVAIENNMVDSPGPLPMSVFWLGYQYAIFGVADMFTLVGLLEFFYEESSPGMKSLGTAISWCSMAFGYYMSSMVVEVVNKGSTGDVKTQARHQKRLGGTRAAMFAYAMIGLENMAFIAMAVSLVTYFYGYMNFSLTKSATTLTNFSGTAYLLSLFGGFISDTYLSRFKTCILFASFEVVGYALLAIQARFQQLRPIPCNASLGNECEQAESGHEAILFTGLYLIAFGTGGIKAALPSLGADQFDQSDPKEAESLASFFNWFLFSITTGAIFGVTFVVWISSNQGWDWGFGICSVAVLVSALFLLMGKSMYRNYVPKGSPISRILQVFVVAIRNRNIPVPEMTNELHEMHDKEAGVESEILQRTENFRWGLHKIKTKISYECLSISLYPMVIGC